MLLNYLLTAYRNTIRDRLFSTINVIGLALGFAASLLIFIFVWSELNYDRWIKGADQIYRLESTYILSGRGPLPTSTVPAKLKMPFTNDFADSVEDLVRVMPQNLAVRLAMNSQKNSPDAQTDKVFNENIAFVDAEFFDIFPLNFVAGNALTVFKDPSAIAINQSMAEKYFGTDNPVGQILTIQQFGIAKDLRVSAVYENLPVQSHMVLDMVALIDENAFETGSQGIMTNWFYPSSFSYFRLKKGAELAALQAQFPDFSDRHDIVPKVSSYANIKPRDYFRLVTVPVQDIHLDQRVSRDMKPHGSRNSIYVFSGIAILLLFIASVNFINLATARSLKRSKEVALRKTLGAKRSQLVVQFLLEGLLTILAAALLALGIVEMVLPLYNQLLDMQLSLDPLYSLQGGLSVVGFLLVMTLVSGAYPAFYVSRARPGKVLHSNKSASQGSVILRSVLVTFQFAISIALISSTLILYQQNNHLMGLDLGYQTENIAVLNLGGGNQTFDHATALKQQIERIDGVEQVGLSSGTPDTLALTSFAVFSDAIDSQDSTSMPFVAAGFGYFETYKVKPIAGRLFSKKFGKDELPIRNGMTGKFKGTIIINESAVQKVGFSSPREAIGKQLRIAQPNNINNKMTIVGVVPDLQYGSARQPRQAMIFYNLPPFIYTVSVRYNPAKLDSVRSEIETIWRQRLPDVPLGITYIEDMLAAQYDAERRQGSLLTGFSILTVLVAGFGLYGLAAFMAARRTREVGIRKVLGARVIDIVVLFVWSLSQPLLIANIIAWPVAWYYSDQWLSGFVYRIDLSVLPFIAAGVIVSLFGILVVAGRTYSVARTHPNKALRVE